MRNLNDPFPRNVACLNFLSVIVLLQIFYILAIRQALPYAIRDNTIYVLANHTTKTTDLSTSYQDVTVVIGLFPPFEYRKHPESPCKKTQR